MQRWILHCDMNSYYASVELLSYPELRDRPVVICGSPKDRRGIVLAKNEPAKRCGVLTAETIWSAERKCPELVLLPPHYDRYDEYNEKINAIYVRYTDLVEPFSIDESWLDVTGSLVHFDCSAVEMADDIRTTVRDELGLTLSVGVSYNKIFAKMGSDYRKPDATTLIDRNNYRQLLWPMPARKLFSVGAVTAKKLQSLNIRTIGDIAMADEGLLSEVFGKHGIQLHRYANGRDDEPVAPFSDRKVYKSVGNGITFRRNLLGREEVRTALIALSDRVAGRLRNYGLRAGGVKLDIKDPDFRTISRQLQLDRPTDLASEITDAAMLLAERSGAFDRPIRLLTVTGINLEDGMDDEQLSIDALLEGDDTEDRAVEEALDDIREKFGRHAIVYGGILDNDLGISYGRREDIEYEEVH